jgi:hypothetical protein
MSYALHSQNESFAVPFVVVDIVDFVDDVSEYVAAEAVFCVVTEVPVAVSLSDEPLPGYAISV